MSHRIRILESGVVEIVHTGDMTIVEATASRDEAAAMMKEHGLSLVLADVSQTNHDESTMDLLDFNASHYEVLPRGSQLAVVIPSDPAKAAPARFAETVALNRGIAMRIFLEYDEAMNWLNEE
jgi:hypothetical protein